MTEINIAFSPCPNDTFIFHALLDKRVDTGPFEFIPHIDDVEALNVKAFEDMFAVTKLSYHAYLLLKDRYELMDSGSALGFGCGPLLVAKKTLKNPVDARIAIPGMYTTAYLLLKLWCPGIHNIEATRFDNILPGVESGRYDAGLIIHEGRFTYPCYNCIKIIDLGEWWEKETCAPIPLGCIAVRKDPLILPLKPEIESILKSSVQYALENRNASRQFVRRYARELDNEVIEKHINFYVNEFTVSLGKTGRKAVQMLEDMARCRKIL
jgi:1,4-dihydroxy-6-naphthoate synthase